MLRAGLFVMASLALLAGCDRQPPPETAATPGAAPTVSKPDTQAPDAGQAARSASKARFNGYGALRFGMSEAAVRKAWDGALEGRAQGTCFYLHPAQVQNPSDFAFMFEHGAWVRYDVGGTGKTAPGGGRVGMRAQQIHALYGKRVQVQPHKYIQAGRVLRVAPAEGRGVLVFEIGKHGRVLRWRVGWPPQVDYVEGCS